MSGYLMKARRHHALCSIDWREGYLDAGESLADDLGWSVTPTETVADAGIIAQLQGADTSDAIVAGGVPGKTYMLSARVRTDRGRELACSVVLQVAAA